MNLMNYTKLLKPITFFLIKVHVTMSSAKPPPLLPRGPPFTQVFLFYLTWQPHHKPTRTTLHYIHPLQQNTKGQNSQDPETQSTNPLGAWTNQTTQGTITEGRHCSCSCSRKQLNTPHHTHTPHTPTHHNPTPNTHHPTPPHTPIGQPFYRLMIIYLTRWCLSLMIWLPWGYEQFTFTSCCLAITISAPWMMQ